MVLDLDGGVIAKVLPIYNGWALAAMMGRKWVAKMHVTGNVFEGHSMEGGDAKLVTWPRASLGDPICDCRPVT